MKKEAAYVGNERGSGQDRQRQYYVSNRLPPHDPAETTVAPSQCHWRNQVPRLREEYHAENDQTWVNMA
jgi:hypothetical protein